MGELRLLRAISATSFARHMQVSIDIDVDAWAYCDGAFADTRVGWSYEAVDATLGRRWTAAVLIAATTFLL